MVFVSYWGRRQPQTYFLPFLSSFHLAAMVALSIAIRLTGGVFSLWSPCWLLRLFPDADSSTSCSYRERESEQHFHSATVVWTDPCSQGVRGSVFLYIVSVLAHKGDWLSSLPRYTSPDFLYVRSWLPCIFFAGGITMGNIGRQLAMVS